MNAGAQAKGRLPQLGHDRRSEARRLFDAMEHSKKITDGQFSALGMLITDASLCGDEPALTAVQDGLQWLHRNYLDTPALDGDQREERGRVLGLIDTVHWALRRLPSGLQLSLHPDGHAARFLVAVARRQGLSNRQLAAELGTDETEISRVGRKLLSAGVVWRRKEWRHNAWDITPRGLQYAQNAGLLRDEAVPAARSRGGLEGRPRPDGAERARPDETPERAERAQEPGRAERTGRPGQPRRPGGHGRAHG
ncbi:hypothetical protein GCM10023085_67250 [Actinomadura viridis]|uniref:Uncharacterized protein n=1 Tax=Actinomadura viridis TaxID=58110 RepID=A0A931GL25_9ACTN|nr:hypothetical protein [Actinomadura viridis]MBG6091548.1 hypothetical protein [Actinomadura viridis]